MVHRFDQLTEPWLRRRGSLKWTRYGDDVLPAWVAEMDFPLAEPVVAAARSAVDAELFGYPPDLLGADVKRATVEWSHRSFGWRITADQVRLVPDVVRGLEVAIDTHSPAGSPVILTTPAYPPFFQVVDACRRPVVQVPLVDRVLDLSAIDAAFAAGARTLLLCNPHNPTGRVFTRTELADLAELVDRRGGRVVADEVHAPLVYPGHQHIPYATVSPAAAAHTVTLISASKAWNLPGLRCAQAIVTEADARTWADLPFLRTWGLSPVGMAATVAAYRHGGDWLTEVVAYLDGNRRVLAEPLAGVGYTPPEGTYLAWLDFRELGLEPDPAEHLLATARVALSSGPPFGAGGAGRARLNFATPRPLLERIAAAISEAVR